MKSRTHQFIVSLTFDKKCTRSLALRELRDTFYGDGHYTTQLCAEEPAEYSVRSVRLAPRVKP